MARMIICKECGEERLHRARGLCKICYGQKYRRDHPGENTKRVRKWRKENPEKYKESSRKWYEENKEEVLKRNREHYREHVGKSREGYLKRTYNITIADYDFMLESQGNACAICGMTPKKNGKRLAVDHNHETGEIRGLLCDDCNRGLGDFKDNPQLLARAIEYLLD